MGRNTRLKKIGGKVDIATLIKKSHKQVLEARTVDYLISTREFEETWGFSSLPERNILNTYSVLTIAKIRLWMEAVRRNHIDILKTRELKQLARALKIINYSRLTRAELQTQIWEHYESRKG